MKKLRLALLGLSALLFAAGCTTGSKYIEGTHLAIGAYIPYESNLYGLEICQYLAGCYVKSGSNTAFTVTRDFCATNSYFWGMIETRESTHTTVETKKR